MAKPPEEAGQGLFIASSYEQLDYFHKVHDFLAWQRSILSHAQVGTTLNI
jgi:hypothetical protein